MPNVRELRRRAALCRQAANEAGGYRADALLVQLAEKLEQEAREAERGRPARNASSRATEAD